VLEEVWYLERSGRAGRLDGLAARAYTIFTPLLPVTDDAFGIALTLNAPLLGPADRLHVGTCLVNEIDVVVTADAGYRGVRGVRALDPLDPRALRRVLADST
jgi:predicted nucleic acid-binding protein